VSGSDPDGLGPVVAEVDEVRLRLRARQLRGSMTLVEASRRAGLNRDELSRLEKGETSQVRFSTLARLVSIYRCSLDELLAVERVPMAEPLYSGALSALAEGALPLIETRRRATRRAPDLIIGDDAADQVVPVARTEPPHRRRRPVGTVHR
jgi:transcriptional regulator with XRE-family HTH domain